MKFTLLNLTAILTFIILFSAACSNDNQSGNVNNLSAVNSNQIGDARVKNANAAKDDVDELGKIIKLPLMPEEATYWEENVNKSDNDNQNSASNGKKFIVVLKYSPENAAQLVSQIEKIKLPVDAEVDAESQFPAELVAQSQLSGDETLKGKSFAADDFFQTPYNNGKITRIENTDYFVLELTTN
jgi:hypothetical protein